jgi:steroid 5-alpha reductase family enzyme
MQGVWVFLTAIPVFILNSNIDNVVLDTVDFIGMTMWLTGFLLEVVADNQKRVWKAMSSKSRPFINVGLWAISRHPNC